MAPEAKAEATRMPTAETRRNVHPDTVKMPLCLFRGQPFAGGAQFVGSHAAAGEDLVVDLEQNLSPENGW